MKLVACSLLSAVIGAVSALGSTYLFRPQIIEVDSIKARAIDAQSIDVSDGKNGSVRIWAGGENKWRSGVLISGPGKGSGAALYVDENGAPWMNLYVPGEKKGLSLAVNDF